MIDEHGLNSAITSPDQDLDALISEENYQTGDKNKENVGDMDATMDIGTDDEDDIFDKMLYDYNKKSYKEVI